MGELNDQDQSWTKQTPHCSAFRWDVSIWSVGLCSLICGDALLVGKELPSLS